MMTRLHPLMTPARLARDVGIYLRQSSPRQVRENWGSTEIQRAQIHRARELGYQDHQIRVLHDLGKNARGVGHRDGWQEMIRLIVTNVVGCILAFNVARLSRRLLHFEELRILCRQHDVVLWIDDRPFDPQDANDTAMGQIQAIFAELDNRRRADDLRRMRVAKAEAGKIVSPLPVGWEKLADGSIDYDPAVKPAIDDVLRTFDRVGTVRKTVAVLDAQGKKLPTRPHKAIEWKRPSLDIVRRFLLLPAYTGTVVFGKTEVDPLSDESSGKIRRRKVPQDQWIVHEGLLPAYMTPEAQQAIRQRLAENAFNKRDRPGIGRAICQGLLRCRRCNGALTVAYPRPNHGGHRYQCTAQSANRGARPCFSVQGEEVDQAVERLFLAIVSAPSVEQLRHASKEAEATRLAHVAGVKAELNRLRYQEQLAKERYENVEGRNRNVAEYAAAKFEAAIQARKEFELRIATQKHPDPDEPSEQDIEALCALVADIPSFWRQPAVTNHDRKEMLRCLIGQVTIDTTPESIEGEVEWLSGARTPFKLWRKEGLSLCANDRETTSLG